MWTLLTILAWSLTLGAEGKFATERHDGSPFKQFQDVWRIAHASLGVLGFYLLLVEFRADWPGFCKPLGFRAHNHSLAPCPFCWCPLADLLNFSETTLESSKHPFVTDKDVEEEFEKLETCQPHTCLCFALQRHPKQQTEA